MIVKKFTAIFVIISILLLCTVMCEAYSKNGPTYTTDGSQFDVQAAVTNASDGDTITLPALGEGNTTWSSSVTLPSTKSLIIQGAGIDTTYITDGTGDTFGAGSALVTYINGDTRHEITGITFVQGSGATAQEGTVFINGSGNGNNFRIHHCRFKDIRGRAIKIYDNTYGLIDNCTFDVTYDGTVQGVSVFGSGATSWALAQTPGTANAVYIEDCTFNYSYINDGAMDAYDGARYVFRYNAVNGTIVGHHGNDSGALRSVHTFEIYNNTFSNTGAAINSTMGSRGGTGVVFNNTITGNFNKFFSLSNYRSCPYFDGTHDGGTLNYLVDSWADFDSGDYPVNNNYYLYNATDGSYCKITGHTTTTVSCTLTGGSDNRWENGDAYAIFYFYNPSGACTGFSSADGNESGKEGYPCQDQTGRTTGQVLSPLYFWGNTFLENPAPTATAAGCNRNTTLHTIENRDFYNNTEHPSYTPYAYPHPLRGDTAFSKTTVTGVSAEDGSGCFIATTVYGSDMAQEVIVLKKFRDHYLLKTSVGKKFVWSYYQISPSIATFIKDSEFLKSTVRIALTPIVFTIKLMFLPNDGQTEKLEIKEKLGL